MWLNYTFSASFSYFHIIWATGDIIIDMICFCNPGDKKEHGMWGTMALCGKMEWGKMALFHFTPKGVSFCPSALVRFASCRFQLRKCQWRKCLNGSGKRKLTHCGRVAYTNLCTESSLDCFLCSVTLLYLLVLTYSHLYTRNRYNGILIQMQRLSLKTIYA